MAVAARSRPIVGKYAFWVRDLSQGIVQAKFQKCTGIGMTVNIGELSEGGSLAPMKEATRVTFANATLEHGVFENLELYEWILDVCDMLAFLPEGAGVASPEQLRNLAIDQLRRDRSVLRSTVLHNAQPAGYKPGEHDNTSNDAQVEELEIAYEYFTIK